VNLHTELLAWRKRNKLSGREAVEVLRYFGLSTTIDSLYKWEKGQIPFKRTVKKLERILEAHAIVDNFLFRKITAKPEEKRVLDYRIETEKGAHSYKKQPQGMVAKYVPGEGVYETHDVSSPIAKRYLGKPELERETFATQSVCGFGATPSWQWHSF
jgi:hypothetical protein